MKLRTLFSAGVLSAALIACGGGEPPPAGDDAKAGKTDAKAGKAVKPPVEPPTPVQQPLKGEARPSLLLVHSC